MARSKLITELLLFFLWQAFVSTIKKFLMSFSREKVMILYFLNANFWHSGFFSLSYLRIKSMHRARKWWSSVCVCVCFCATSNHFSAAIKTFLSSCYLSFTTILWYAPGKKNETIWFLFSCDYYPCRGNESRLDRFFFSFKMTFSSKRKWRWIMQSDFSLVY